MTLKQVTSYTDINTSNTEAQICIWYLWIRSIMKSSDVNCNMHLEQQLMFTWVYHIPDIMLINAR